MERYTWSGGSCRELGDLWNTTAASTEALRWLQLDTDARDTNLRIPLINNMCLVLVGIIRRCDRALRFSFIFHTGYATRDIDIPGVPLYSRHLHRPKKNIGQASDHGYACGLVLGLEV